MHMLQQLVSESKDALGESLLLKMPAVDPCSGWAAQLLHHGIQTFRVCELKRDEVGQEFCKNMSTVCTDPKQQGGHDQDALGQYDRVW